MMVLKDKNECTFYHFVNRDDIKTMKIDTLGLLIDFKCVVVRITLNDSNINKLDDVLIFKIRGFVVDKIDSHEETTVEELRAEIKELIINHGN